MKIILARESARGEQVARRKPGARKAAAAKAASKLWPRQNLTGVFRLRYHINPRIPFSGPQRPAGFSVTSKNKMKQTKNSYATYKKILERKSEEVRRSMSAQKAAQVVARLDIPSDEGDLSQQSHEEWIFLNRNTIDMKLLREVSGALQRIDTGQYGICPECDEPISSKRLDAVPWARYCVTCQDRVAARLASGDTQEEFEEVAR